MADQNGVKAAHKDSEMAVDAQAGPASEAKGKGKAGDAASAAEEEESSDEEETGAEEEEEPASDARGQRIID